MGQVRYGIAEKRAKKYGATETKDKLLVKGIRL
jgi:hypothetical protein